MMETSEFTYQENNSKTYISAGKVMQTVFLDYLGLFFAITWKNKM